MLLLDTMLSMKEEESEEEDATIGKMIADANGDTLARIVDEIDAGVDREAECFEEELAREDTKDETLEDAEELAIVDCTTLDVCEAADTCGNRGLVETGIEKLGRGKPGCTAALELESSPSEWTDDVDFSITRELPRTAEL
ncbi:hypothetical protein EG328_008251 [Venturia inaequalis]|uniref:Uncharacterized protein n=1 Tax=Venturia inaequalis TaxID=5025 RepID=A0A8H3YNQ0_VENIN|nr:hypothetical protein EG328_008251 [Venturia inaequalis]